MVEIFRGNDKKYLDWCIRNRNSHVLNSNNSLSPISTVIHRASCYKVTELKGKAKPGGFTQGSYFKVGAENPDSLREWLWRERLARAGKNDGAARNCPSCM